MATVAVRRPVLEWARRRSGRDTADMRSRFKAWDRWLSGDTHPTFRQAQQLAEYTHVPFGSLLMTTPPVEVLPIPDFRVGRSETEEASQDLLDTLYLNQRRQAWYEDYLATFGADPLEFVGSARGSSVNTAAATITAALDYGIDTRRMLRTVDAARRHLVQAFEAIGGLVVVSSMVGNNTHRMLDLEEFRGFTLHSTTAPLVFVNGHDTKRGQMFSLLHEFAHVWRGDSGVSAGGEPLDPDSRMDIERWCDQVAAQIAVPASDVRTRYRENVDFTTELERLGDFYKCSTLVVLIRLRDVGFVPATGFQHLYDEEVGRLLDLISEQPERSGGTFYNNQPYRIGETLSRALIRDARRGRTPVTEALSLMSFKSIPVFDKYAASLGES